MVHVGALCGILGRCDSVGQSLLRNPLAMLNNVAIPVVATAELLGDFLPLLHQLFLILVPFTPLLLLFLDLPDLDLCHALILFGGRLDNLPARLPDRHTLIASLE